MIQYFQIGFNKNIDDKVSPIAGVKTSLAGFHGKRDKLPPLYILSWGNTVKMDVLDAKDNKIKKTIVLLSDLLSRNYRCEVLTWDNKGKPLTWRFVAKDRGQERADKLERIERGFNNSAGLKAKYNGNFDMFVVAELADLPEVWTVKEVVR